MRIFLLLCVFLTTALSSETKIDHCATSNLAVGVRELLNSKFGDLRSKTLADLEGDDQRLWLTSNPRSCPGIAVGNFEGSGKPEYAILLIPASGTEVEYKVVVFAAVNGSSQYRTTVLDYGSSTPNSGLVLSRVPSGRQTGFDETKSVSLKLDGINVEWLEKSSVLYYYSNGRFRHLQTSD